jgi:hypothetical protein
MVGETAVGMMSEAINNQGAGIVRCPGPEHVEDMRRTMASDVHAFSCVCFLVSLPMRH